MKIWENIIEKRIRSETSVTNNQSDFFRGKLRMELLLCVRQLVQIIRRTKSYAWCL